MNCALHVLGNMLAGDIYRHWSFLKPNAISNNTSCVAGWKANLSSMSVLIVCGCTSSNKINVLCIFCVSQKNGKVGWQSILDSPKIRCGSLALQSTKRI